MPLPGDIRKQVVVQVRTDGEGLTEKLAVELANAQARMVAIQNEIASGNTTVQLSQRDWKALNTEISFLSKELTKASNALAQSDPEFARYQERLRAMTQETANAAAATEEKSRREVATALNAVRNTVEAIRSKEEAERKAAAEAEKLRAKEAADAEKNAARVQASADKISAKAADYYIRQTKESRDAELANERLALNNVEAWRRAYRDKEESERKAAIASEALRAKEAAEVERSSARMRQQMEAYYRGQRADLDATEAKNEQVARRTSEAWRQAYNESAIAQQKAEAKRVQDAEKAAEAQLAVWKKAREKEETEREKAAAREAADAEKTAQRVQAAAAKTQQQMDAYFRSQRSELDETESRSNRVARQTSDAWRQAYGEADVARQKDSARASAALLAQEERTRKELQATLDAIDKKAAAREKEEAKESARNQRELEKLREILDAEAKTEEEAQRARESRWERRQRMKATDLDEGFEAAKAQQQVKALEEISRATETAVERFDAYRQAIASAFGASDANGIDRSRRQFNELLQTLESGKDYVSSASKEFNELNTVINVGAAYAQRHNTTMMGFSLEMENAVRVSRGLGPAMFEADKARQIFGKGFLDLVLAQKAAGGSADEMAEKQKHLGYSILHIAHAAQDAQYGLGAVLNNVPLLAQAFGAGPGLAGKVMLAAVGMDTLYNNADKVASGIKTFLDIQPITTGFVSDVDRMKEKVEELEGAWLKLPPAIQAAKQASLDLKHAEEAAKIEAMPGESQEGNKAAFGKAVKAAPGGGNTIESMVQDVAFRNFMENPGRAAQEAVDAGRIPENMLQGVAPKDVMQKMADDDQFYQYMKEKYLETVIPLIKNETMDRLGKGEIDVTNRFMADLGQNPRFGGRDEQGDFTNPVAKAFEENLPANVKKKKADIEWASQAKEEVDEFERQSEEDQRKANELKAQGARQQIEGQQKKQRERDQEVRAAASTAGSQMDDALLRQAIGMKSTGSSDAAVRDAISGTARSSLESAGVGNSIKDAAERSRFIDDVTREIADKFLVNLQAKLGGQIAGMAKGATARSAASSILGELQEKDDRASASAKRTDETGAARDRRLQIARGMQKAYGLTDDQAQAVAPSVDAAMQRGVPARAAGQAAMAKLREYVEHQQKIILEQLANDEHMAGVLGQATMMLGQLRARNAQVSGMISQAGRGANGQGMFPVFPPR